jgi:hypothetical protein
MTIIKAVIEPHYTLPAGSVQVDQTVDGLLVADETVENQSAAR